jgi:hypothetical protein
VSAEGWYAARLRHVVLIEGEGASRHVDSIRVFRSADFDTAFQRALDLGRAAEDEYMGGEGKRVRRRFTEVLTLDGIDAEDLDGAAVYEETVTPASGPIAFDTRFAPEQSKPRQTV